MSEDRIKWLADILARVRRKLASHRDDITHAEAHKVREIIADVDAAALITKEIKNERTQGSGDANPN
ncbi:MAG: hypothetical protein EBR82_56480 [Caulobacteraceae bacterium]|nr:hypothetical protein [Caulobacteraceae bacterium]